MRPLQLGSRCEEAFDETVWKKDLVEYVRWCPNSKRTALHQASPRLNVGVRALDLIQSLFLVVRTTVLRDPDELVNHLSGVELREDVVQYAGANHSVFSGTAIRHVIPFPKQVKSEMRDEDILGNPKRVEILCISPRVGCRRPLSDTSMTALVVSRLVGGWGGWEVRRHSTVSCRLGQGCRHSGLVFPLDLGCLFLVAPKVQIQLSVTRNQL